MAIGAQHARVVSFGGTLDVDRARQLLELMLGSGQEALVLDLRGAREIHDAAIGLIVRSMEAQHRHVEVRGLRTHQVKLLELLGSTCGSWPVAELGQPS